MAVIPGPLRRREARRAVSVARRSRKPWLPARIRSALFDNRRTRVQVGGSGGGVTSVPPLMDRSIDRILRMGPARRKPVSAGRHGPLGPPSPSPLRAAGLATWARQIP